MRQIAAFAMLWAGVFLAGCQSEQAVRLEQDITVSEDVVLHRIDEGIWVHTTYKNLQGYGRVGANGLVVIDGKEALLIDLPWTDEQTAVLFDRIARDFGAAVTAVVPTHFHEDCMGGLAKAHRRGAASYALDKTVILAKQHQLPVPQHAFTGARAVHCGKTAVMLGYFGAGHTLDNIVAWLPQQKVLFGGCLIKSLDSNSLGNTTDGDLAAYPKTVREVRAAYPRVEVVVPGHGAWGGAELIDHTLTLCEPGS